jgi:hypothetical protein
VELTAEILATAIVDNPDANANAAQDTVPEE